MNSSSQASATRSGVCFRFGSRRSSPAASRKSATARSMRARSGFFIACSATVRHAVLGSLPELKLDQALHLRLDAIPHPHDHVLGGGVLHDVVEVVVIAGDEAGLPD